MASSPPSSRTDRARHGALAAFTVFALFLGAGVLVLGEVFTGIMAGAATFLFHRQLIVRAWLLADHNRGVALVKNKQHTDALAAFQASERAWTARPRLDRHRAWFLASASRWGFRAQARYNQALCLHALGRSSEAQPILRSVLTDHPQMGPARALLEYIEATGEPDANWDALHTDLDTPA
mgnify:CR=1 FL=1